VGEVSNKTSEECSPYEPIKITGKKLFFI